ncbi:glycosyltransferase [Pseudoalteromonas sp. S558]|uniref:glycosyltransferase n=1 Tax=Pseudoalteromonas sp. S558 TaxID=2066515 RepID=UPI00110B3D9A|nr:glycosyltransferase [Pseudoalteromonas sp. S558]TMO04174.1 hypothetical protein CWB66_09045 [Pseudoalteromonas sp. S558]
MFERLIAPSTEQQITKHWQYSDKVYTSIICTTFNQEDYIRDAINGFLAQITQYKFEIIIHDDLSTDNTRLIIKEYQQKYPSIIKLVLQDVNQFSMNINLPFKYSLAIAKGEYVALCEGDDFWVDSSKLQKQLIELNKRTNVNLCVHNAFTINSEGMAHPSYQFPVRDNSTHVIDYIEIYKIHSQFSPTASMFIRKSTLDSLPNFFYDAPIGDFFLEALSGINGVVYLHEKMSVYRRESHNSWSSETINNINKLKKHNICMLEAIERLECYTKGKYSSYIQLKKQFIYGQLCMQSLLQHKYLEAVKYFNKYCSKGFHLKSLLSLVYRCFKTFLRRRVF